MDEERSPFGGHLRQVAGRLVVEEIGHGGVALGFVDIGVGGAVDYDVHLFRITDEPDGLDVGDIEPDRLHTGNDGDIGKDVAVGGRGGEVAHFAAELPGGSGHKYSFHTSDLRYCPYSFLDMGPAASRSFSLVIQPLRKAISSRQAILRP